jgi:hypothetical protein
MEENATVPTSPFNHAAKWGAIYGAVSIVISMLIYAIDFTLFAGFTFLIISLVVGFGFVIYGGINYRNEVGGYLAFGKAYIHGFIMFAVAAAISTAFSILLFTVIDPDLPQNLTDAIISNTEAMMQKFGAPQDSIDQTIDQMREEQPKNFAPFGLVKSYFFTLIWYAILSLITGLIVKKNQPEMV